MRASTGIWRRPAVDSDRLYPNLSVHDGVQTGSIVVGHSRLPLWAIIGEFTANGWEGVTRGWPQIEEEYGFTRDDFSTLLNCLLEMRGEFSPLLLALANAERTDKGNKAWWNKPTVNRRVRSHLPRCVDALDAEYAKVPA